ncbi:MAG: 4Fe-4S binding protein [Gammaproteobacteria bacterium]
MKRSPHAPHAHLRMLSVVRVSSLAWLLCLLLSAPAAAARDLASLEPFIVAWFEGADAVGDLTGAPPAAAVISGDKTMGYVFFTGDIAPLPAYSGKPVDVMVGLDRSGTIAGVRIVHHEEPILVVGITEDDLSGYVRQYEGLNATTPIKVGGRNRAGYQTVDGISGATISVMVINNTVTRAAKLVAQTHGLGAGVEQATPLEPGRGIEPTAVQPQTPPPLWLDVWQARPLRLAILGLGLFTLTTILMLQDWLTRYPTALGRLRAAFLVYTLGFIGWYGLAQLSVVNVLTFLHALSADFNWETFLIEPMIFVLWSFVAMTLLLWGRGVYCGWLCPFGALQELVNRVAQRLRVPQYLIPELVHERLLAIKYLVLIVLFGLSLQSMTDAVRFSEVEPFKTAITLRFQRDAPYVVYALVLIVVSVFNGKFFCKYLCPLGAALAIGSHFRIFDWLHRRRECGRPCQTCASECPSQAIRPTGEINAHECHYCLDCQVTFWNAHKCPPLVERRKRFERRGQPVKLTL